MKIIQEDVPLVYMSFTFFASANSWLYELNSEKDMGFSVAIIVFAVQIMIFAGDVSNALCATYASWKVSTNRG